MPWWARSTPHHRSPPGMSSRGTGSRPGGGGQGPVVGPARPMLSALQSWVLRGGGRTVLVDTGVRHDRERPAWGCSTLGPQRIPRPPGTGRRPPRGRGRRGHHSLARRSRRLETPWTRTGSGPRPPGSPPDRQRFRPRPLGDHLRSLPASPCREGPARWPRHDHASTGRRTPARRSGDLAGRAPGTGAGQRGRHLRADRRQRHHQPRGHPAAAR